MVLRGCPRGKIAEFVSGFAGRSGRVKEWGGKIGQKNEEQKNVRRTHRDSEPACQSEPNSNQVKTGRVSRKGAKAPRGKKRFQISDFRS